MTDEEINFNIKTHKIRSSDASTFDFVCTECGATDQVPGGWGGLKKRCPKYVEVTELTYVDLYN